MNFAELQPETLSSLTDEQYRALLAEKLSGIHRLLLIGLSGELKDKTPGRTSSWSAAARRRAARKLRKTAAVERQGVSMQLPLTGTGGR